MGELVRQGVGLFVVCPGSRSTPLAVAVGETAGAEAVVHWDERAAAFVALGWGRATGRPAAVVTTSGTAVANLLPAAVEADADGVPLLLLTADRPPELRETGANQTVRQPPLFQDVARWTLDAPVPTAAVPARWVRSTAAHAVHRALAPPGPVHLNLPFREPLGAQPDGTDLPTYLAEKRAGPDLVRPQSTAPSELKGLAESLGDVQRGVIVVAGPGSLDAEALARLSDAWGWPVLPDVRTPARWAEGASRVPHVDAVLGSAAFAAAHRADAVLHVGGRLTSKRLARFLDMSAPSLYVRVDDAPARIDPDARVTARVTASPAKTVAAFTVLASESARRDAGWSGAWQAASEAVADVWRERVDDAEALSEPAVARTLCERLPTLVVAASMPIRDVEAYAAGAADVVVHANRGASGIDGTVATAAGVARATGEPVGLLIGDLALLHDLTSLALLRSGPPVVVVVVNNDGGGIFHRLPIADGPGALADDTFERFFGTPHGLGFADAARLFGLDYAAPTTRAALVEALDAAADAGASTVIEVRTDREAQAALRRDLEAAALHAVDATLS